MNGFAVVLQESEFRGENGLRFNPRYQGFDRLPAWPSTHSEEESPLWDYYFTDVKSEETNLVVELETARKVLKSFANSTRNYEILFCCEGNEDSALRVLREKQHVTLFGYDVAGVAGGGWSIVGDWSPSEWARAFLPRLNEFGLFSNFADANEYLEHYIENREFDFDSRFSIVCLARLNQ